MIQFILYMAAAFATSLFLAKSTDKKFLGFILIFWIFTQPILNSVLLIKTQAIGFDLQPTRMLFLVLVPYLFFVTTLGKDAKASARNNRPAPFEKYLYILFILVIISMAVNYGRIRIQAVAAIPLDVLTFIVVYWVSKKCVTESVLEAVIKAIMVMAVISALIAFIQIGISSSFLKTGPPRLAFGGIVRATATFFAEYELGYFQILATIIALIKFKGSFWRWALAPLFATSLLLTFHRLDVIILLVCLIVYVWMFGKASQRVGVIGGLVFLALLMVSTYFAFETQVGNSSFVKERLAQDTLSGRLLQYKVILQNMPQYIFGMGDYTNEAYYRLMEKHDMLYSVNGGTVNWYRVAYRVHNGYLEVGILYGVFAMAAFTAMLMSIFVFFKKKISKDRPYSIVPFFVVLVWGLANLTNGVTDFRMYSVVLYAIIFGSAVSMQCLAENRIIVARRSKLGLTSRRQNLKPGIGG